MVLIDSNIVLDIVTNDEHWFEWSRAQLEDAALAGVLTINDIVYAEVSIGYDNVERVDELVLEMGLAIAPMPREALFLAGKVFQRYRAAGGARRGVLPDFFIGAHAAVAGLPLLTRDARRYRTYFPTLELIAPDVEN